MVMKNQVHEVLQPFSLVSHAERIVLYPAGTGAVYFHEFLSRNHPEVLKRIVGLGDRDPNKHGRTQIGLKVYPPEMLPDLNPDMILVTSLDFSSISSALQQVFADDIQIVDANVIDEYIAFESQCSMLARLAETSELDVSLLDKHVNWFTCLPLGKGRYTKSSKKAYTFRLLSMLQLPDDMHGQHVLDLGGSDGFYSFECLARGADKATTVESLAWNADNGFQRYMAARDMYKLNAHPVHADVETYDFSNLGMFDTILCLGLYYHLKNPMGFFEKLRKITGHTLILSGRAATMPLVNPATLEAGLPSNKLASYFVQTSCYPKWLANMPCLCDMLHIAGFQNIDVLQNLCPEGSLISSVVLRATV